MPFLPTISSDQVYRGWWRNYTAPTYRQLLWTASNEEAILILGILGIVGAFTGDRLWLLGRRFLQPRIQLPDPDNIRLTLSRSKAISALLTELRDLRLKLGTTWRETSGFRQKLNTSFKILSGADQQTLHHSSTAIEPRFGIFAILNILGFALLGIFVPFLLAEGLQGETVVQAATKFWYADPRIRKFAMADDGVLTRVDRDVAQCVRDRGEWTRTKYCTSLRHALLLYKAEEINLSSPVLANAPYRFLSKNGNSEYLAYRLSRNITFQDIAFNVKPGKERLFHELTCIPFQLDPWIHNRNDQFELNIRDMLPPEVPFYRNYGFLHGSMILNTSNGVGSGPKLFQHYRSEQDLEHPPPSLRGDNMPSPSDDDMPTYSQEITRVDGTLPWLKLAHSLYTQRDLAIYAEATLSGRRTRLENFLITFKPFLETTNRPSDDPIFGAERCEDWYVPKKEVVALGCTDILKSCSGHQCDDVPTGDINDWLSYCYQGLISIWVHLQLDPIYNGFWRKTLGYSKRFLSDEPDARPRWQDDVEERFIRSMLRVRHATTFAAESDLHQPVRQVQKPFFPWTIDNPEGEAILQVLLYGSPNHTNINIWGSACTLAAYIYIIAARYWPVLLKPLSLALWVLKFLLLTIWEKLQELVRNIKVGVGLLNVWRQHRAGGSNVFALRTRSEPQANE